MKPLSTQRFLFSEKNLPPITILLAHPLSSLPEEIVQAWERLSESNLFLSPSWLGAVESIYAKESSRIVLAQQGSQLVAVLPLRLRKGGFSAIDLGEKQGDYGGLLLSEENIQDPLLLLREMLYTIFRTTNVLRIRLRNLPLEWSSTQTLLQALSQAQIPFERRDGAMSFWIRCERDFDRCYATLRTAKSRYNLRRAWRRLEEGTTLLLREGGENVELRERLLGRLAELHKAHWPEGCFADPDGLAFAREAAECLFRKGYLELTALMRGDLPLAIHFGLRGGKKTYYYNVAYDPAFAADSPGSLLLRETLRRACERGDRELDLLYGSESYKKEWGGRERPLVSLTIFNPLRALSRLLAWWARIRGKLATPLPKEAWPSASLD